MWHNIAGLEIAGKLLLKAKQTNYSAGKGNFQKKSQNVIIHANRALP